MAERAFIVGVSGAPDAGKTTLTRLLLRDWPHACAVTFDRYQTYTRMTTAQARHGSGRALTRTNSLFPNLSAN